MPRNHDIKKVLVIGSGPIVIGQAAEFDYAGTQACRSLKEEGVEVVLVNSNPATIMTDKDIADQVYIEPLTVSVLEKIIAKEKPDSVLPTLGGQAGLNLGMELEEKGGLVGLNYCAGFLDDQPSPDLCRSTTALMAKHAAHFKQVGGIEIIGLGSDFDGIGGKLELSDCSKMPLLADALRKEGFTEDEVEAIFFRNAQRFFENNL